jgi:hypothetical protein
MQDASRQLRPKGERQGWRESIPPITTIHLEGPHLWGLFLHGKSREHILD